MTESFRYPSVEDILEIHEDTVSEYPDTNPGIRSRGNSQLASTHEFPGFHFHRTD